MVNPTKMVVKKIGSCGQNLINDIASKKGIKKTAQHTYTVGLHWYVYSELPPPPPPPRAPIMLTDKILTYKCTYI